MLSKTEIGSYLKEHDNQDHFAGPIDKSTDPSFKNDLTSMFSVHENNKTVLGIDIYKYSRMVGLQQELIPIIFDLLFEETIKTCNDVNPFIFQKINKDKMLEEIIQTGDGGFIVFETPLHAVLFALLFETNVRLFNCGHFYPKIKNITGIITLRYAITIGFLFGYDNNYYGEAIIKNARVLSKDKLNRLLIDEEVYQWFIENLNGIETLEIVSIESLKRIPCFSEYIFDEQKINYIITSEEDEENKEHNRIKSIIVSKIGSTSAKETELNIYNVLIKAEALFEEDHAPEGEERQENYIYSIGNINSSGLAD